MKRLLVLLAAVAATAGCASPGPAPENDIDLAYVAAIERAAQRYGTQIVWVNYPRKRPSSQ